MTDQELKQAKLKWLWQKASAKRRKIDFDFPFEQWLQFWLDSGHWHQRGIARADQYVMSRIGDTGPYRIDNVEIKTNIENVLEGSLNNKPGPRIQMSCLHCRSVVAAWNAGQHYNSKGCHKKALRRGLSLIDYTNQ